MRRFVTFTSGERPAPLVGRSGAYGLSAILQRVVPPRAGSARAEAFARPPTTRGSRIAGVVARVFRLDAEGTTIADRGGVDSRNFRSILGDVLRASLLSTLSTAVLSCGVAKTTEINRDGFDNPAFCLSEQKSPEALRVALGLDWLAVVATGSLRVRAAGTACGTATNAVTCADRIKESSAADDGRLAPGEMVAFKLVGTKGDEVREVRTPAELTALLTPIDSPLKVFYVLWASGYAISCDRWVRSTPQGFEAIARIETRDCAPVVIEEHRVEIARDGSLSVLEAVESEREDNVCARRRPEELVAPVIREASPVAAWFARAAQLEAASVDAFRIVARELAFHGAPERLVRGARRAARDEIRHAAVMARLAERFGATFTPPTVEARPCRSLFELARENAVEKAACAKTYGAIEAALQAELASDSRAAQAMRRIAHDEAGHAELAWQIASWAHPPSTVSQSVVDATLEAGGKVTATCRGTFVAVREGHPAFHRW